MASDIDPVLDMAQRHVREGEQRARRQVQLIAELESAGHWQEARTARELLAVLTDTLDAAKAYLRAERRVRGGSGLSSC